MNSRKIIMHRILFLSLTGMMYLVKKRVQVKLTFRLVAYSEDQAKSVGCR